MGNWLVQKLPCMVCNSKYLVYFLQVPFKNFDFYDLQFDIQESVRKENGKFSFLKG